MAGPVSQAGIFTKICQLEIHHICGLKATALSQITYASLLNKLTNYSPKTIKNHNPGHVFYLAVAKTDSTQWIKNWTLSIYPNNHTCYVIVM